jgi:hypothetical protein
MLDQQQKLQSVVMGQMPMAGAGSHHGGGSAAGLQFMDTGSYGGANVSLFGWLDFQRADDLDILCWITRSSACMLEHAQDGHLFLETFHRTLHMKKADPHFAEVLDWIPWTYEQHLSKPV